MAGGQPCGGDAGDGVVAGVGANSSDSRLGGTAQIRELASHRLAQNFGDTLRRHAERYRAKVVAGATHEKAGDGIVSAHDRVAFKHGIDPGGVVPDAHARHSLRDARLDAEKRPRAYRYAAIMTSMRPLN